MLSLFRIKCFEYSGNARPFVFLHHLRISHISYLGCDRTLKLKIHILDELVLGAKHYYYLYYCCHCYYYYCSPP